MIPFASQRGLGQDLATHLQNEFDNDYMEVADLRGAIAQDLHGAFAEWELQAHTLTKCRNYLYSLSINPDQRQGLLTRAQYMDYIDRTEERLGLSGQPRAIVFHIKDGREHCHVVWSRIDTVNEKAVHMAYDHDKLMMVTREFARDHGLALPKGYEKGQGIGAGQISLYEMHQQRVTGLTKAERMEQITDLWRGRDNPLAFMQALAQHRYILARGKRPYVLIDIYGGMNALPKLIDDKDVKTKHIRAFLEKEFPEESLPTIEEAKALAAEHRKAFEAHREHEQKAELIARLKQAQAERRQETLDQQKGLKQRQHRKRTRLQKRHRAVRDAHRNVYLAQVKAIKKQRYENRPKGLAAFLGKVTGVNLIRKKLARHYDRKRLQAFLEKRAKLKERQEAQLSELAHRHQMQALDMSRKVRALDRVDARERKSLEEGLLKEQRIAARGGQNRMPVFELELKPRGRKAAAHKAANRHRNTLGPAMEKAGRPKEIDLEEEFSRAAADKPEERQGKGDADTKQPEKRSKVDEYRRNKARNQDKDKDRDR